MAILTRRIFRATPTEKENKVATPIQIDDVNVLVSGQGGDGSLTVTNMLGSLLRARGMGVYTERDVLSRIKGGKAAASLRGSVTERFVVRDRLQLAVIMDEEGIHGVANRLGRDSVLLYDSSDGPIPEGLISEDVRVLVAPFGRLAVRRLGRILYKNSISTGVVARVLSIPDDDVRAEFRSRFKRLGGAITDQNLKALDLGFEIAESMDLSADTGVFRIDEGDIGSRLLMTGNEAIGMGFIVGGGRFFAGYPITPATDVLEFLQRHLPQFGGVAWQGEDELASVNMAIGAALTGVRSGTGSSGPGIALMQEGIGQAGSGEVPLVVVDTQRAGPSTGMPTKPEQSDLNMVCFGGNGDFERIVLVPGDPEDCFWLTVDACNLAQKYQMPVFIVTDQAISQNTASVPRFDLEKVKIDVGKRLSEEDLKALDKYQRYAITEDGVSPYTIPGTPGGQSLVTGNERDEFGNVSTLPGIRHRMADKRKRKLETAKIDLPKPREYGSDSAEIGIIAVCAGWGAGMDAVDELEKLGIRTQLHHPRTLWPLTDETRSFIDRKDRTYVIDHSSSAQLSGVLMHAGVAPEKLRSVMRYDGTPLRPVDLSLDIQSQENE